MKKIIIINGKPGEGKDLFASFLKEAFDENRIEAIIYSSVDQVKRAANILGWNGTKTPENRDALSKLKDLSSSCWNGPFKDMDHIARGIKEDQALILMIREPAEIEKFVFAWPNTKTILIQRDIYDASNNHADLCVEDYRYDMYIENNSIEYDLLASAKLFVENYLEGE